MTFARDRACRAPALERGPLQQQVAARALAMSGGADEDDGAPLGVCSRRVVQTDVWHASWRSSSESSAAASAARVEWRAARRRRPAQRSAPPPSARVGLASTAVPSEPSPRGHPCPRPGSDHSSSPRACGAAGVSPCTPPPPPLPAAAAPPPPPPPPKKRVRACVRQRRGARPRRAAPPLRPPSPAPPRTPAATRRGARPWRPPPPRHPTPPHPTLPRACARVALAPFRDSA